jgi:hypothetical protein
VLLYHQNQESLGPIVPASRPISPLRGLDRAGVAASSTGRAGIASHFAASNTGRSTGRNTGRALEHQRRPARHRA